MKQSQGDIQIYVACLAAYNNGILHGCWIDAEQDAYDIYADIRAMLAASPIEDAEEWAIHDHEGFEGADVSEYMGIDEVAELAAFIGEHGEIGGKLVGHFGDLGEARKAIEDAYAGEYRFLAEPKRERRRRLFASALCRPRRILADRSWCGFGECSLELVHGSSSGIWVPTDASKAFWISGSALITADQSSSSSSSPGAANGSSLFLWPAPFHSQTRLT
ncbi:antirestriction protein ArdA [Paracoccus sp. (in: a-proteobacteria)]|uniref:antirestriction protein ArdA n=1 Tax=Paracoccus sp. TaxID=267 RepID=UPI003A8B74C0